MGWWSLIEAYDAGMTSPCLPATLKLHGSVVLVDRTYWDPGSYLVTGRDSEWTSDS